MKVSSGVKKMSPVFVSSLLIFSLNLLIPKFLVFFIESNDVTQLLPFSILGLTLGAFAAFQVKKDERIAISLLPLCLIILNASLYFYPFPLALLGSYFLVQFFAGWVLSLAFKMHSTFAVMAVDMLGGFCGILVFLLLPVVGGERLLLFLTIVAVIPVLLNGLGNKFQKGMVVAVVLLGTYLMWQDIDLLKIAKREPSSSGTRNRAMENIKSGRAESLTHAWSYLNRIDVLRFKDDPVQEARLYYDNILFTQITSDPSLTASHVRMGEAKSALIVGVGGGDDILALRNLGYSEITALEMNWATIQLMTSEPLKAISNNIYSFAEVLPVEGRRFLAATKRKYDYISVFFADTVFERNTPLFYSENLLYTREGISTILESLNSKGILFIGRGFKSSIERNPDAFRLIRTLSNYFRNSGRDPKRHLVVFADFIGKSYQAQVFARNEPWEEAEVLQLKRFLRARRFFLYPYDDKREDLHRHRELIVDLIENRASVADIEKKYNVYVEEVTDDKPFFYHFMRTNHWQRYYNIFLLTAAAMFFTFLVINLWSRGNQVFFSSLKILLKPTVVVSAFGFGVGLLEILLIQVLELSFLHPVYNFILVLTLVCVGGGLASWSGLRIYMFSILKFLPFIYLLLLLYFQSGSTHFLLGIPLWARSVIITAVCLPLFYMSSSVYLHTVHELKKKLENQAIFLYAVSSICMLVGMVFSHYFLFEFGVKKALAYTMIPFALGVISTNFSALVRKK